MKHRERAFLYTVLALIVSVQCVILIDRSGPTATAGSEGVDDLGPADRLLLAGPEMLTVRNASGRLAWGDGVEDRAYSTGFVNLTRVLPALLETPRFKDARDQLMADMQAQEDDWRAKFEALQEKYAEVTGPEHPRAAEAQAEAGGLQRGFQVWQQEAGEKVNAMAVEQLKQGYQEVLDAVNIVADREGIDMVMRFTPPSDPLPGEAHAQTMLDIRMRPVLRSPEGLDITDQVMSELSLEDLPVDDGGGGN
ncbi:MAG: OmpH family outer membrane protein [Phycisphaerales bacterium]